MTNKMEDEILCHRIAQLIKDDKVDRAVDELVAYGCGCYQEGQFDAREGRA